MTNLRGARRTLLFVPGSRPDRFDKADESGADMVCLDLEDAVLEEYKSLARSNVVNFLESGSAHSEIVVRINSPRTRRGLEDLLALASASVRPALVAVPKVESAAEVDIVSGAFREHGTVPELIALIETLRGIERLREIASATGVAIAGLGTADLAAEMEVAMDWAPMLLARLQLVQAAKAARIQALDGAWLRMDDTDGLAAETRLSAALGYSAKVCLHPRQVAVVHEALKPTAQEVDLARDIVTAFESSGQGTLQFRGRMIDLPVVEAARRTLAAWQDNG